MYYDAYDKPKKRPKRRRKRRGGCLGRLLGRLLAFVIIVSALALCALYLLPVSLLAVEPQTDLHLANDLPTSPINILLLGVDAANYDAQRSDTMMVVSIGGETVKLTSIQRDTLVNIEGHGMQKINAAYAYGGAELAMRTVNDAFDLNVMHYVVVDFAAVVRLVDALGGIEVDITEAEMQQINRNVVKSWSQLGSLGYRADELAAYGANTHLDGLQALGYARIRKIDSDFKRTSRQRTVIEAMLKKLRENIWNPAVLGRFLAAGLSAVESDLNPAALISLGEKALLSGGIEQFRLPADGTYTDDGSALTITNRNRNIDLLREFIYSK